jgi:hypothetical protein
MPNFNKKTRFFATAFVGVLVATLIASPASAMPSRVEPENLATAACMTATGKFNGAMVIQDFCRHSSTYAQQLWNPIENGQGSGYFTYYNAWSGRCLDTSNNHASNVDMYVWACNGLPSANQNQLFLHIGTSHGFTTIRPMWNLNQCISIRDNSHSEGAHVNHANCNGTQFQEWLPDQI